jgi:PAS domain S-box-containing protein
MAFPEDRDEDVADSAGEGAEMPAFLRDDPTWALYLVRCLPVPLIVVSRADGKILFCNGRVEAVLGWKASKLQQRSYESLFPHIPDRKQLLSSLDRSERTQGQVLRAKRRDGSEVLVSVWKQRTVIEGIECVMLMFVDVTDQKLEQHALAARCESLNRMLAVSERERQLIGYEIHDGFVQDMVTALMHLDAYRWAAGSGDGRAAKELALTVEALRDGVREARRLIDRVEPPDLTVAGLVGAVRMLVDKTAANSRIAIEFSTDLAFPRLADQLELGLYRMVQECLNNIQRHSQAERARVQLLSGDGQVAVEVRDWGKGFDPAAVEADHFGLMGIRHRARLLNGRAEICSSPGWGTQVTIRLPVEARAEQVPSS